MYETFGAFVAKNSKTVEFRVFFPDAKLDPEQYSIDPGKDGNPRIAKIQVGGNFQSVLGGKDFDFENGPTLEPSLFPTQHPIGRLYTFKTNLPEGFYQYKYWVTFESGEQRVCTDPCTKYGGGTVKVGDLQIEQTAGFVVGGNFMDVKPIANRLPQNDLIIYELMVEDFTTELMKKNPDRSRFDAVKDKIDYLLDLGINAIQFLPWTAFIEDSFSWGYDPYLYYSVENRYTNDPKNPLDKLFKLKALINFLHEKNIHVIMDGVFHQVNAGSDMVQEIRKSTKQIGSGFPYYWLYENPNDSPFIGTFKAGEDSFGQQLLNFNNRCTLQFIADSCKFFLDEYGIDGIRFDDAKGYYIHGNPKGIPALIATIRSNLADKVKKNISLILEDLNGFQEVDDTNKIDATGCWFDEFRYSGIDTKFLRVLNAGKDFAPGKAPVSYIENHDHSTVVTRFFGRANWFRTQPLAIALLTSPGTVMLHNGQEFGEDYFFPEPGAPEPPDNHRVSPRPLHWDEFSADLIGKRLYDVYQKLISIRKNFSALRSSNFFPDVYDETQTHFNPQGYGIDVDKQVVIYHRWGQMDSKVDRFIVVVNFSPNDQFVDIPFSLSGQWDDLLNDSVDSVSNFKLFNQKIGSNWGRIYYQQQIL